MREPGAIVEIRQLVVEAAQSLSVLDVDRLELLALSCEELNHNLDSGSLHIMIDDPYRMKRDMASLARVLEATRSNLSVMNRLRELHRRHAGYHAELPADLANTEAVDGIY
jgi:hypothetical protein